MGDRLKGKTAIVTGSRRGIGRSIAIAIANEGGNVVISDIVEGAAEPTAQEIVDLGGRAIAFTCDVGDFKAAGDLVNATVDAFGTVDVLVNNAALVRAAWIWDSTEEDFDLVVGASLKGAFNCTRHASQVMRKQGWGRIINASSAARLGIMKNAAYAAAKAGVVGFTTSIAFDLGKYGITCNAYCPSAQTQSSTPDESEDHCKTILDAGLINRAQYEALLDSGNSPDTVAPFIVYLCTEEASHVTGQVFEIHGREIGIYSHPALRKSVFTEQAIWSLEELIARVPGELLEGYQNPLQAGMESTWPTCWHDRH